MDWATMDYPIENGQGQIEESIPTASLIQNTMRYLSLPESEIQCFTPAMYPFDQTLSQPWPVSSILCPQLDPFNSDALMGINDENVALPSTFNFQNTD